MKTSNKLIIAAVLLLVLSLIGFDYLVRQEYISGAYKDPYKDFVTLKFKNFDAADIISSTTANVKFVQGPYAVKIDTFATDYTNVKQQGKRLLIESSYKGDYLYNPQPYLVVISCPKLAEVNVNAVYLKNKNIRVIDTIVREDWNMRKVLIESFKQDSLFIRQNYGSTVVLSNNHIRALKAVVGIGDRSGSKIVISNNNRFQHATLDILNRSRLFIYDNSIQNLEYHLADSAQIIFNGAAQNLLKNSKPKQ